MQSISANHMIQHQLKLEIQLNMIKAKDFSKLKNLGLSLVQTYVKVKYDRFRYVFR